MRFGDLFWVNLPDRGGREQRGRRPALIWQDTEAFPHLPTVLIIPLTSQLETVRFRSTLTIEPPQENGLSSPSVVLVFQLGACDIRRFGPRIGRLSETDLKKVKELVLKLQKLS